MAEELRLQTNERPKFINDELALSLLATSLIPVTAFAALPIAVCTSLGCALVGGYLGKRRMEQELAEGKKIKPPSLFNKQMLFGALIGANIGGLLGEAGVALVVGTKAATATVLLVSGIVGAVGAFVGGVAGGLGGKDKMKDDYQEAKRQQWTKEHSREPELAQDIELSNSREHQMKVEKARELRRHLEAVR